MAFARNVLLASHHRHRHHHRALLLMPLIYYWFVLLVLLASKSCSVAAFVPVSSSAIRSLLEERQTQLGFHPIVHRPILVVCSQSSSSSSSPISSIEENDEASITSLASEEKLSEGNDMVVVFDATNHEPSSPPDQEVTTNPLEQNLGGTSNGNVTQPERSGKHHPSLLKQEQQQMNSHGSSALLAAGMVVVLFSVVSAMLHSSPPDRDFMSFVTTITKNTNPQDLLQQVMDRINAMDHPTLYYALFYGIAELAGIPATPLTISAGVLLGFWPGVVAVMMGATVAASVAFGIGKTVLRSWVEEQLEQNSMFARIDRAVGREGFLLVLLVRLSPIFPFGLSSYLYGGSSITFGSYFLGTLLGFTPATLAYVYTGMVGKELALGNGGSYPWYVYVTGFAVLATFLKTVTDVATRIIESVDDDGHIPSP